jgi:hypothetical protein
MDQGKLLRVGTVAELGGNLEAAFLELTGRQLRD